MGKENGGRLQTIGLVAGSVWLSSHQPPATSPQKDQKSSFKLSWMFRSEPFPVTRPNDPLVGFVVGLFRFGWFGKLNASARNCTRVPVGAPTVLKSAMSQL